MDGCPVALPTLQQLRAFVLVVECGGYEEAAAAGELGSRANLWQLVQRLEKNLATQVGGREVSLLRSGGHELTALGRRVFENAQIIDQGARSLTTVVEDEKGRTGPLRISCYPAQAPLVAQAANECWRDSAKEHYRLVRVEEARRQDSGSTLLADLLSGALDVVIGSDQTLPTDDPDLTTTRLYDADLVAVVNRGHRLFGEDTVDCRKLSDDRLLRSPPGHLTWNLIEACGRPVGASEQDFTSDSVETLVEMALLGAGVAIIASDSSVLRLTDAELSSNWPRVRQDTAQLAVRICVATRTSLKQDLDAAAFVKALAETADGHYSRRGALRWYDDY